MSEKITQTAGRNLSRNDRKTATKKATALSFSAAAVHGTTQNFIKN